MRKLVGLVLRVRGKTTVVKAGHTAVVRDVKQPVVKQAPIGAGEPFGE